MSEQEVAIVTEKRGEGERGLIAQDVIYFHAESRGVSVTFYEGAARCHSNRKEG